MVKATRRKGGSRNAGGNVSEQACLVRDTVMVRAEESEDVPFEPLSTAEEQEVSSSRPVRVYADGIFDLFHFGHARALEQAKKLFPNTWLIVGCCNDELTHKYKGRTVLTDRERYESLRHCKWVDEVIMDAPWVITQDFLDKHKIDYVTHDQLPYEDTSGQANDVYDFVKKMGKFRATQRTEGVSTSDIILRIIRNYNDYVLRQLSRGYTRKELGLSFVREQQIRMKHNMKQLGEQLLKPRLGVRERVRKRKEPVRLIPREVEQGLKEFAAGVEQTVDRLVSGELGAEMTHHMDVFVSGFIRGFETNYSKFEQVVKQTLGMQQPPAAAAKARQLRARRKQMALVSFGGHDGLWQWQGFRQSASD